MFILGEEANLSKIKLTNHKKTWKMVKNRKSNYVYRSLKNA